MDRRSLIVFFMVLFWLFTPNMLVYSAVLTAAFVADISGIATWGDNDVSGSNNHAAINSGLAMTLGEDRF